MKIAIGCDHRGIEFKKSVIKVVEQAGYTVKDFGSYTEDAVDYPDIAKEVGEAVVSGDYDRGILICGTGIGMCIAANKIDGIRAALCHNDFCALRSRQHNDANVLCMGSEIVKEEMPKIVNTFLTTEFEGGRHQRRVDKMKDLESQDA
ncbi:MAG: ribose 5-phosphate isomerase B [Chloroflexi bacterium RBG_13_46_14]|nr:MAG: ribose 5-phosphate isomerase B [Chloroflexi bacterium RBG_13_46_14]